MNGLGVLLGLIAGVVAIVMALTAYLIHKGDE